MSCLDDAPVQPPRDNQWDPENPNPPREPDRFRALPVDETKILLTWRDRSGNEDGFIILEAIGLETDHLIDTLLQDIDFLLVDELEPKTEYRYQIQSFNTAGSSIIVGPRIISTAQAPPLAPTGLMASVKNDSTVTISWIDQSEVEDSFEIQRSIGSPDNFLNLRSVPENQIEFEVSVLSSGISHFFRIRSVNQYGKSNWVGPVIITI